MNPHLQEELEIRAKHGEMPTDDPHEGHFSHATHLNVHCHTLSPWCSSDSCVLFSIPATSHDEKDTNSHSATAHQSGSCSHILSSTLVKKRVQELSGPQGEVKDSEVDANNQKSDFIKRRVQELGASFSTDQQPQSNGQTKKPRATLSRRNSASSPPQIEDSKEQSTQQQPTTQQQQQQQQKRQTPSPQQQTSQRTDSPQQKPGSRTQSPLAQSQRTQSPLVQNQRTQSPHQNQGQRTQSPAQKSKELEDKNIKLHLYLRSPDKQSEDQFFEKQDSQEQISVELSVLESVKSSVNEQRKSTSPAQKDEVAGEEETLKPPPLPKNPPPPPVSKKNKPPPTKPRKTRRSRAQQSQNQDNASPQTVEKAEKRQQFTPSPSKVTQRQSPQGRTTPLSPTKSIQRQSPQEKSVSPLEDNHTQPQQQSKLEKRPQSTPSPSKLQRQSSQEKPASPQEDNQAKPSKASKSPVSYLSDQSKRESPSPTVNKTATNKTVSPTGDQAAVSKTVLGGSKSPERVTANSKTVITESRSPETVNGQANGQLPGHFLHQQERLQSPLREVTSDQNRAQDHTDNQEEDDDDDEENRLKVSVRDRIRAAEKAAQELLESERLERERLGSKQRGTRFRSRDRENTESPKPEGEKRTRSTSRGRAPVRADPVQRTSPQELQVAESKLEVTLTQPKPGDQLEVERRKLEQKRREQLAHLQQENAARLEELQRADKDVQSKQVSVSDYQEEQRLQALERHRLDQERFEREQAERERLRQEASGKKRAKQERLERERTIQERLEHFKVSGRQNSREGNQQVLDESYGALNQQQVDSAELERLERRRFIESQLKIKKGERRASPEDQLSSPDSTENRLDRSRERKQKHQEQEGRIQEQKKVAQKHLSAEQNRLDKQIEKQQKAQSRLDRRIQEHKRKEEERLGLHSTPDHIVDQQQISKAQLKQKVLEEEQELSDMMDQSRDQPTEQVQRPDSEYEHLLEIAQQLEEKRRLVDEMLLEKKRQFAEKKQQLADTRKQGSIEKQGDSAVQQMTENPKNAYIKKRAEEIIGRSHKSESTSPKDVDELHAFKPVHPAPVKSIPSAVSVASIFKMALPKDSMNKNIKTRHPSEDIGESIPTAKPVPLPKTSKEESSDEDEDVIDVSNDEDDDDGFDDELTIPQTIPLPEPEMEYSPHESYLQKAQGILRTPQSPSTQHSFTFEQEHQRPNGEHLQHVQQPARHTGHSGRFSHNTVDGSSGQTADEMLSKFSAEDVKNKLMELRQQFMKNTLQNVEPESEPEPEPKEPDMTSEEVVVALGTRQDEPEVILNSLTQLQRGLQTEGYSDYSEGMSGVLLSMMKHPGDNRILMLCSSCLLIIMKSEFNKNLTDKNRSDMLAALMNCLDNHPDDAALTRRCCSCLEQFDIPYDMLLDIDRVVQILVRIVTPPHLAKFVQLQCVETSMALLDKLALPHPDLNKPFEANLGALSVHAMLEIIEDRLHSQECDSVMETAWSVLWNVTYDTPENCVRFMTSSGLDLFLDCIKIFRDNTQLHVNMIGLMTNLAEARYVRTQLMKPEAAEVIANVWEFMNHEDTQLSYLSCSVMARLVADGTTSWKMSSPTHKDTSERIVQSIASWNMNKSGALYRGCTLQPVLRLVTMTSSPEAQYWAAWTVCSLVKNDTNKYCLLLERENGKNKLEALIRSNTSDVIKELANKTLEIYAQYKVERKT